jgi:hypothetical protein
MFQQLVHEAPNVFTMFNTCGNVRFIERKSKHIGFYVVVNVHFMGRSVYVPYLQNRFTEIFS